MTIIKKIPLFHLVLTGLLLWYADLSAQSISNLVVWNSIKNTELVARDLFKSGDNIASGNIKNQHRAYIETGTLDNTRYIFEKLKLEEPFIVQTPQGPVTLTGNDAAELYVRSKFLAMYQNNANYFWTNSSMAWWQSVSGQNFLNSNQLSVWLDSQTYNSTWLDFITVK